MSAATAAHPHQARGRVGLTLAWLQVTVRRRLRERPFWTVQAGVLAVTALHIGVEAAGLHKHHAGPLGILAHLPVFLYLVPVSYAGFRYGYEGSILTGVWAALLAIPNLFVWHAHGLEWLGELLLMVAVISIGVLVAIPVEREQRQRRKAEGAGRRAEATSHRLALLNELAEILLRTAHLDAAIRGVMQRLLEVLPLQAAALVTCPLDQRQPCVELCHRGDTHAHCRLASTLACVDPGELGAGCFVLPAGVLAFPCPINDVPAALSVHLEEGHALSADDRDLLTTVATQISVALDNANLHRLNEERLQTYLQQVTGAQEEERRRIARDLHDVATHELLLLCRDLDAIADDPPSAAEMPARVQHLRARTSGIVAYLRRFGRDLRPGILDTLGLSPALQWLATELGDRSEVAAVFELEGRPRRFGPDVELSVFRIVQEALRNAERHADAEQVSVCLRYDDSGAVVEVSDDGSGFDVPSRLDGMVPAGKLGLAGMRERAQLAGCRLSIDSQPGGGTRVHVATGADNGAGLPVG